VVLAAGAISLAVPVGTAGAISTANYALQPVSLPNSTTPRSDFTYALRPGQNLTDEVALSNFTDQPQTFLLYGADGYNVTAGGGFALRPHGYHNVEVGTWITLITTTYTLPPRTSADFPFEVRVPLNASPGDHVGGIAALNVASTPAASGKVTFQIRHGIAVALYVRVSGPLHPGVAVTRVGALTSEPALAFAEGNGRASVFFTIHNIGNVDLRGTATVKVTDVFGDTVRTFRPVKLALVTPGAIFTVIEPVWKPLPAAGPQHVVVRFVTDKAGTATAADILWIIPWVIVAVLAAIILGIVFWWRLRRRRRRRRLQPSLAAEPEPAEPVGAAP
jgi:hypothetical protein